MQPIRARALVLPAFAAALTLADNAPAHARQDRSWKYDAELGASIFFGASRQTAALARNRIERKDDRLEFGAGAAFDYGEARDADGENFVNKRSWAADLSTDYSPGGRLSPFLFATAEGSLERQIALRSSGGGGARYRFVDSDRARVDFSLAALFEHTDPRDRPGVQADASSTARWSARLRLRRALGDDAEFQAVSFFRPSFEDFDDHTWDLTASFNYTLSSLLGLRLSLVNRYDSLARQRGARSNNDGRLFFSVVASVQ